MAGDDPLGGVRQPAAAGDAGPLLSLWNRPLPLRRLALWVGGVAIVAASAVLALIVVSQLRITRVAQDARDTVLPQIVARQEMAHDVERLLLFGERVIHGAGKSERREARLSAQVLAFDANFRNDPEIARLVQETYRTIDRIDQLCDRRDVVATEARAILYQAEQLPPATLADDAAGDAIRSQDVMLRGLLLALAHGDNDEAGHPGADGSGAPATAPGDSDMPGYELIAAAVERLPPYPETEPLREAARSLVGLKRSDRALAAEIGTLWRAAAERLKGATDTLAVQAEMDTGDRFTSIVQFAGLANGLALAGMAALLLMVVVAVWLGNRFLFLPLAAATRILEAAAAGHPVTVTPRSALIEIRAILTAARRLARSENRYRVLVENAPDVIYSLSAARGLLYINGRVTSLLGYSPAVILEEPGFWPAHVHPDDADRVRAIRQELAMGNGYNFEYRICDSGGDWRWFHDRSFDIRLVDGDFIADGLIVDITWQKTADEALEDNRQHLEQARREAETRAAELAVARDELSQFAYAAAHDLQEPVRVIASHIQLLERQLEPLLDDPGRESFRYILMNARRIKAQLRDVEMFIAEDTAAAPTEVVSANAALSGALAALRGEIAAADATVERMLLPTVIADFRSLQEVFFAVIGNALEYRATDRPCEITVSAAADDDFVDIAVRDNGIGIAPQHHQRIFQVFRRLHSSAEHPGTGMGLALARKIAKRMGGDLRVESELGKGATFILHLRRGRFDDVPAAADQVDQAEQASSR